ncbi:hypothetical protein SLEP1_g36058 [Rubroshorea leprosula]|uniref:Protein kinase domain-containing protein n=1 Tax=Rubroshorea leprosula TaxID=152421 RepID=A0AAV5KQ94_9ROSI|nr:hypothetical protein SLEP1_g36058 [Rubroshorea leprosula]
MGGISIVFGLVCLPIGTRQSYKLLKRKMKKKLQRQFFKQNGGLLVQQQLPTTEVYKSKALDKVKIKEFIDKVVILAQTNCRNIVKLLGCCLETEVPLLVYEFIPNGTLFQYIHDQNGAFPLTWERQVTIAAKVAGALSYLHSAASIPIYHRDVKSSHILVDGEYMAKVSNFRISRSIAIDQTHLITIVKATFGYLDPNISGAKEEEARSLASHFILSMDENTLFNILDAQLRDSSAHEEITKVAKLAYRCLSLSGRKWPKMIEVAAELEQICLSQNYSNGQQNHEEVRYVNTEVANLWDGASTSTGSGLDSGVALLLDMES